MYPAAWDKSMSECKNIREVNISLTMFFICEPKDKRINKNMWSCTTKKIYYPNEHSHMRGMKGIRAIWSAGLLVLQQSNWANQSAAEVWAPSLMPISCRARPAGWHHGVCFRGDDWHCVRQSRRETCVWRVISRKEKSGGGVGVVSHRCHSPPLALIACPLALRRRKH